MKHNTIWSGLALAAIGILGLSSCKFLNESGLNPFEPTMEMQARVTHASTATYSEGKDFHIGGGKARQDFSTAGYSQTIIVKASDGNTYKGTLHYSTAGECASTGDVGIAKIGKTSHVLKGFEASR